MSLPLTRQEADKIAWLARLRLEDAEIETLARQLGQILEYIDILGEVDTEDVEPMAHAVDVANVFRDDAVRESLPRDAALANAPRSDGQCFLVPEILESS
jgi:aspartyl-tRNA(Asn)/glutamyl-tRNA(Gln) amidotransferase subunit C